MSRNLLHVRKAVGAKLLGQSELLSLRGETFEHPCDYTPNFG